MSEQVTAAKLAERFGKSRAAVSQWVSAGKLNGCYTGEGRARRFDVAKCAAAIGEKMDPGQALGNGAGTGAAARTIANGSGATALASDDLDRHKLAKIQTAEAEARRKMRQNAEEEGAFVLASAVQRETARVVSAEIAAFENMLTSAARAVADETATDFKVVRKVLRDRFREHRKTRAEALAKSAGEHMLTTDEEASDI